MNPSSSAAKVTGAIIITTRGSFTLDAVLNESHSSPMQVTQNPVESGSTISDNVIMTPRPFELSGVMVDYNPAAVFNEALDALKIRTPDFINNVAIPCQLKSITSQTLARINKELDMIGSTATQLAGGQSGITWLAKTFPGLLPEGVADMTVSDTRIADLYAALRSVQISAERVSIITTTSYYQNMLLLDVRVRVNKAGSAVFTIPCKEVNIVDTQTAEGVTVPVGTTGGRTSAQISKTTNKGTVQLSPYDTNSTEEADERAG